MVGNEDRPEGETVPGLVASSNRDFGSWESADEVVLADPAWSGESCAIASLSSG